MMQPRRIDRFLNVHPKIHHADQNIRNRGNDGRAARRAQHQKKLAVFQNNSRRHRGERPLGGANGVGRALDESIGVGHALLGGEVVHFVVEQKAQALGGDARSEGIVERGRDRHRVAFWIDHRKMSCISWLANRRRLEPGDTFQFVEDLRAL